MPVTLVCSSKALTHAWSSPSTGADSARVPSMLVLLSLIAATLLQAALS